MKVKLILSLAVVSLLALSSCKKDYNCVCSYAGISADSELYTDVTKGDAESRCEDYEAEVQQAVSGISCTINEAE